MILRNKDLNRLLADRMSWHILAWLIFVLLALFLRFYMLEIRAMSHDESLHAYYAYVLYSKGIYQHNPMMHGPLLFHLNSVVFWLFGDNDLTARIIPAILGVGTVALTWTFRRYIGAISALIVAFLFTISPSLLFYSRYLRNDIYSVFFALLWILGAFRYVNTRNLRWVYLMIFGMAFSFITKEVSFIYGAIIGSFFLGKAVWGIRKGQKFRTNPFADLAILMLTCVLPFLAPLIQLFAGLDTMAYHTSHGMTQSLYLIGAMAVFSATIAFVWFGLRKGYAKNNEIFCLSFGHWITFMFIFWDIQCLFFSTFFANPKGLLSGIMGSLGYWLQQQGVARGSQPPYYYTMLISLYEFLPAILTIGAVFTTSKKNTFYYFLFWWVITGWLLYTWAGEKMPWLVVHLVVPMCLLGARWLGNVIHKIKWGHAFEQKTVWIIVSVPLIVFAIFGLMNITPFQGRDLVSLRLSMRWLRNLLFGVMILFYLVWCLRKTGWKLWQSLVGLGLVALLSALTLGVSLRLNFINYDLATEFLVYAHGTPDIKKAVREIESISMRTIGGRDIAIAFDDETSWPFTWYLRNYPNQIYYGDTPWPEALKAPIVLVGPKNYGKVRSYVSIDYVKRPYLQTWWPYSGKPSWKKIKETFLDSTMRNRLWLILLHRRYPGVDLKKWPYRKEFEMYINARQARADSLR